MLLVACTKEWSCTDALNADLRGIVLGFPYDQLLNQDCPYLVTQRGQGYGEDDKRGILLPYNENSGTGNVLIVGPPGSAKTTLAIQFAVACARRRENRSISAYVSLETTPAELRSKARPFQWEQYLHEVRTLDTMDENATDEQLGEALLHVLTQAWQDGQAACPITDMNETKEQCSNHAEQYRCLRDAFRRRGCAALKELKPRVLLTGLSPRPSGETQEGHSLFWVRYRQLENSFAEHPICATASQATETLPSLLVRCCPWL